MKPGRNDLCPCGSGKKYKRCCGGEPFGSAQALRQPQTGSAQLRRGQQTGPQQNRPRHTGTQPIGAQQIGALVTLLNQERLIECEEQAHALLSVDADAGMLWKILSVAQLRQGKDALHALRRTAALMPQDAEAHANLGEVLHSLGRWSEALPILERVLAIQPDHVEALIQAADAIRALGRPEDAIAYYEEALRLSPMRVEALNNLGNALVELGQYEPALSRYRVAAALQPQNAQIHGNLVNALAALGNALFEARRMEQAAAAYAELVTLQPEQAHIHLRLGIALRAQRLPKDAEARCRAALDIDPDYVEALSLLGELLADRGQFSEAEELFRRAIAINPDFSFAYSSIATHRKMSGADGDWLAGVSALLAKPKPAEQEISLRFALGKYHDDVGDFDAAFQEYRRANELAKLDAAPYDGAKLAARVDWIMRRFDAAFIRACRAQACESEVPVFIIGMPRSGTSLTEQILASHPSVVGAGEVAFWDRAFARCRKALRSNEVGADWSAGIARDYLERLTAGSGSALRVVDKMPANFLYAGLIHALLPRARIIHMRRHPIDTCLSIYFQNFFNRDPYANDLNDLAHYYRQYLRLMDHWRALLPADVLMEIPYEGLIEDQEGFTRRMLDFIGLPWDAKCLEFHRTERVVITASKWQVRQKIHAASAGRWKNYAQYVEPLRTLMEFA